jgi:hypothetical protein
MKIISKVLSLALCLVLLIGANVIGVEAATIKVARTEKLVAEETAGTVELRWRKVDKATGYKVYQIVDGKLKAIKTVTTNKYVVKGLTAGETYKFAVKTYRKYQGKTYWSSKYRSVTATTDKMGKTPTPTATATKNTVTLKWDKVEGATGYRIYQYSPSKDKYVLKDSIKGKNTYKVTSLKVNKTYKFKIKPYAKTSKGIDWNKASSAVKIKTVDTKAKFTTPGIGTKGVTLNWESVPGATNYKLYRVVDGELETVKSAIKKTTYKVERLESGKEYTFVVRGYKKVDGKVTWYAKSEPLTIKTNTSSSKPDSGSTTVPEEHTHTVVIDSAVEATCNKEGLTEGKHCSVCNEVILAQQTVAKKEHTVVIDPAVEATCEKTGLTEGKHCSVCNEVIVAQQTVSKAHDYTAAVTKEPTCKNEGVKTYTCTCGDTYTEAIAKSEHTVVIDPAVEATCEKTGLTEGKHCSVCNEVIVAQQTVSKAHNYTATVTTQPTCKTEGVKTYRCACGDTYTEKIAKGEHTIVTDPAVAATCTSTGLSEGKHCSVCNEVIVAQQTVVKKDHTYTATVTTQPTCKTEGLKTYTCTCGDTYTEKIAKGEHTIVTDPAVAATCTSTGLSEGKHCSVCNTVTVAQSTVAMKEHKDSNNDGKCDACSKALSTQPTTPPSDSGLTAYRVAKYKSVLNSNTVYFKISSEYSDGAIVPIEFAMKNGDMYMETTAEGLTMRIYYDKSDDKMMAYADLLVAWVYYDVPKNEMKDMDMTEMLEVMQIGEIGDITATKTTFNKKSVICESFYDSKTGYTMKYYFDGETLVGIERTHPKKVDEIIYVEEVSNTVKDSIFDPPKWTILTPKAVISLDEWLSDNGK